MAGRGDWVLELGPRQGDEAIFPSKRLRHESPMIAASVLREILSLLDRLAAAGITLGRRSLVIGFGAIGRAVARALVAAGWSVDVHDADESNAARARAASFVVRAGSPGQDAQLSSYDLVVGCTGNTVLAPADCARLKDRALLVSASSSDVEFSGGALRRHALANPSQSRFVDDDGFEHDTIGGVRVCVGRVDAPTTKLWCVRLEGKSVLLANGGFPVNFDGSVDPIRRESIQLTRALLYAGVVQASRVRAPGLVPLDDLVQHGLWRRFCSL